MPDRHDVVVVGAGPGGSAAAAHLARAGLDVVLVDKAEFPRDKTCGDALSPMALALLGDLGLGWEVEAAGYAIEGIRFTAPSGRPAWAAVPPHPGLPSHALVLPRTILDDRIRQAAVSAGAVFEGRVHARAVTADAHGVTVRADRAGRPVEFCGQIAILAVGASLPLLRSAGLANRSASLSHAARAYFEGLQGLGRDMQIRFDGVPLPGYAWIFPISETAANVGAGVYRRTRRDPSTAAAVLQGFLAQPAVSRLFNAARRLGPVKGFPLRTDFHRAAVVGERVLLVGEAAGLVNPFSGEGIEYALDSARLAGEILLQRFETGDLSRDALGLYEAALRRRYQRLFTLTHRLRALYMNPLLLDPLICACRRWPAVARLLVEVLLGYLDVTRAMTPAILLKVLRCLARPAPADR